MNVPDILSLDNLIRPIYEKASKKIMDAYHSDNLDIQSKLDSSPVTRADLLSHQELKLGLQAVSENIPVLSEEEKYPSVVPDTFWLIDPLDGTKEFINKSDEFTVNIALIHNKKPVYGFVGAPAINKVWTSNSIKKPMSKKSNLKNTLRVVGSKSHQTNLDSAFSEHLLIHNIPHEYRTYGSSLKICMLASGEADLYPRFGPTSEWDIAAAHAVLLAAGGDILNISCLEPLEYGKTDTTLNPYFVAFAASLDHAAVNKIFNEFSYN